MKRLLAMLSLIVMFPLQSYAYQFEAYGTKAQSCYAQSMVGMDSVINARAGVPPEHALTMSLKTGAVSAEDSTYFTDTLIIMLDAYLWQDTPHSYALEVFFNCASGTPSIQSAQAEIEN